MGLPGERAATMVGSCNGMTGSELKVAEGNNSVYAPHYQEAIMLAFHIEDRLA